jgi:hypothetical protein
MPDPSSARLEAEIELLEAMYPDQTNHNPKAHEFNFKQAGAVLQLRLPDTYPNAGQPDVIGASDAHKNDIRNETKAALKKLGLLDGEEALDAIIAAFSQLLEAKSTSTFSDKLSSDQKSSKDTGSDASKTVIIWLHHLLALTKRKLAISPVDVAGITKPGYPGIMIFSGPFSVVTEHVNMLKAENWQAFQVRYEEKELWTFAHERGVKEVETMAEAVKAVEGGEHGKTQKDEFLKAVGIKQG